MNQAMLRLSTGKRINSGADDPAGISVAARLEAAARSNRQGIRNANDAMAMVQTYQTAGQNILSIVVRMKELAVQGATDTLTQADRYALDSEYNQLLQEWNRIATTTRWNNLTAGINTFQAAFRVRLDGTTATADILSMTFLSWNPTNATANQNVTGATAAANDDESASLVQAFNFALTNADPDGTANRQADDHIQTRAASSNAVLKLDTAITGMTAELARQGSYINRLQIASDNLTSVATSLEKSQSQIEDADYAAETTELARTQIIAQAATAMLAQANAAPQTILALLQ
jgi:flagellin